jgi:hypothetical protein
VRLPLWLESIGSWWLLRRMWLSSETDGGVGVPHFEAWCEVGIAVQGETVDQGEDLS